MSKTETRTHSLPDKAVEAGARAMIAKAYGDHAEQNFGEHFGDLLDAVMADFRSASIGISAALAAEGLVVVRASDHKSLDAVCEALLVLAEGWKDEGKDETAIALSNAAVMICGRDRTRRIASTFQDRAMIEAAREG